MMKCLSLLIYFFTLLFFSADSDAASLTGLYLKQVKECVNKGWQEISVTVNGVKRNILCKTPQGAWKNGAIVVLHGGGGSYTNWCSNARICAPMVEFSDLAIEQGFSVFAIDSTEGDFLDAAGNSCGKRFDYMCRDDLSNFDLPFIEMVLDKIIPQMRQDNSSKDMFMVGISNGGFMTMRAATRFDDLISAFALVSSGDAYGTYIDCSKDLTTRAGAPGLFYDLETKKSIDQDNACVSSQYAHEKNWESADPLIKPVFKQFHHQNDAGVDLSCMKKAQQLLIEHGYKNDGEYIIKDKSGKKSVWKHFWQKQYNQPVIKFFIKNKKEPSH